MKENYSLILLGGTGAKCGEIFIHMCANGYLECDNVNILYIDSDSENGNAENFKRVLKIYQECRQRYRIAESPVSCFFKPQINYMEANPIPKDVKYFHDLAMCGGRKIITDSAKILMQVLYSEREMEMQIENGFFAHPNVGAAVFAANIENIMKQFVTLIEQKKQELQTIKVFLLGSVFGGTGAAALPTLAKYLKQKLYGESNNKLIAEQFKIGGSMILPYFLFHKKDVETEIVKGMDIKIEANKFATQTQHAIEYYKYLNDTEEYKIFDELYILGHDKNDIRGCYATAGKQQRNLPHLVELYAAMSAVTFFESSMKEQGCYFATVPKDKIGWGDIYKSNDGYFSFFVMMRFAIVMKSLILEELFDYKQQNKLRKTAKLIPWYYDFLDGKDKSSDMDDQKLYSKFEYISLYCDEYIRWFAELGIANIDKLDYLEKIDYSQDSEDIVQYVFMFTKKLLITQYQNNQISSNSYK